MPTSSDPVLRLDGITKRFRVRDAGSRRAWHGLAAARSSSFTAVDDVTLEVGRGELVGLVGANGAGKSTLLKIISRVMTADEGTLRLGGPVISLLEVGAGFHPELTGRENVYLNGAILGLTSASVRRRFDDIVSLAGVERFVDTPIKRFSSGMRVRLAVAVALNLDSDAVILDEVLSVGDAVFQRRCLDRLDEMAATGDRATLLVSHNMHTIAQLCRRVVVMDSGRLVFEGDPDTAVARYYAQVGGSASAAKLAARTNTHGDGRLYLTGVRLVTPQGEVLSPVVEGPLGVEVGLDLHGASSPLRLLCQFTDREGRLLALVEREVETSTDQASVTVRWSIARMPFAAGQYALGLSLVSGEGQVLDSETEAMLFTVTDPAAAGGPLATGLNAPHVVLDGDWRECR